MQAVLLRNVQKADAHSAQGLRFGAGALVHFAIAVLDVAQYRAAKVGEVSADLVGAAGDKADPAQRKRPGGTQYVYIRNDLLAALVLLTLLFFSSCSHHAVNRPDCGMPTVMV